MSEEQVRELLRRLAEKFDAESNASRKASLELGGDQWESGAAMAYETARIEVLRALSRLPSGTP